MKNDAVYVSHIKECIKKIEEYTSQGRSAFISSTLVQDAVFRNFEIIGEAVKQISEEMKRRYPAIPWRRIAGFRDILIHNYLGVDPEEVWNNIERELPQFKQELKKIEL